MYNSNYNKYHLRYQNNPKKKHSGATHKKYIPTSGPNKGQQQYCTYGWMYRKNIGLVTLMCVTTKNSRESEKGWLGSIACTLITKQSGLKSFWWGTMHKATGKVVINDLGIVLNPRAPRGGYCGTFMK